MAFFESVWNVVYKFWYGVEMLSKAWRKVNWDSKSELENSLRNFTLSNPNIGHLRILLHGPVGAGKSTFINSIYSVFQHRISNKVKAAPSTSTSCTKTYKGYEINCSPSGTLPITIVDFMGLEETAQNVHPDDLKNALLGHLPDGYKFNPAKPLSSNDPRYIKNPSEGEKTHCLVCVVSANTISLMTNAAIDKMKMLLEEASELGIPGAVIMTMSDLTCPAVKRDVKYIYTSNRIKTKMEECSNRLQIPMTCIFPVKNYHEEIETNDDTDILLLLALKQIAHFANDYVEDLEQQE
ncbi:interferon-induced protein 44-like [Hemibagrus wyckioides]|uniref:interferon-induced protein 44-like n=1 Tax=Hemibagrus wyckioides TaxID=337641 RepID=UPI00266B5118|nr:interferon-induced protein 44-like [Hemibagrus wyckioides]